MLLPGLCVISLAPISRMPAGGLPFSAHNLPDTGVAAIRLLVEPLVLGHRVVLVDETAVRRSLVSLGCSGSYDGQRKLVIRHRLVDARRW